MHLLVFLTLLNLAFYAMHRLALLITRMEAAQAESMCREILHNEPPQYGAWALLKDAVAGVVLMLLFIACLVLAFAL